MVEAELIRERLQLLGEYMNDLESVKSTSFEEFQDNKVLRRFIERTLQIAMEACLDIGSHIISSEGYREPRYGRDVFEILGEHGWISADVRDSLVAMAGFRNVLVHDYATIDDAIVFGVLRNKLPDLRAFGTAVLARLDEMDEDSAGE